MNEKLPSVSVIMPARNSERFVGEALRSVVVQNYPQLEIIVVDGHSTDRTAEIVKSFDGIRFLNQAGTGFCDALNLGIASAGGELIAFIESDDVWLPGKLHAQISYMESKPELYYTLTRAELFMEAGCKMPPGYRREWFESPQTGSMLSCLVARKPVFEIVGQFDAELKRAGDVDWFARAKDAGLQMEIMPETWMRKRIHDRNLMSDAAINHGELLAAMKRSIERQRLT